MLNAGTVQVACAGVAVHELSMSLACRRWLASFDLVLSPLVVGAVTAALARYTMSRRDTRGLRWRGVDDGINWGGLRESALPAIHVFWYLPVRRDTPRLQQLATEHV